MYAFVPSLRLLWLLGDGRLTDKPPAVVRTTDAFLPIPDMQRINGLSLFWVFHQDAYRIIVIRDGRGHEDQITVEDRPLTLWTSLTG
ncbi:hypothetical protein [Streptomyces sp. NPDC093105]|uniref:hypothetical protein n=1 Tax=Streptomyces sp. NPDC093105 TaxID=3366029 RepID=UPI00380C7FE8